RGVVATGHGSGQSAEPGPSDGPGTRLGSGRTNEDGPHGPGPFKAPGTNLRRVIGRQTDLADLSPVLLRSRLVTLTGPAGVGKPRLAIEFVRRARHSYRGGVWWVELAPLLDGTQVAGAVAEAVCAHDQRRLAVHDVITEACGRRSGLLVLDNCEH